MFNNKNQQMSTKDTQQPKALPNLEDLKVHLKDKPSPTNETASVYLISEGTTVVGDITSEHGIRISGIVKGTVKSNGKCIIASTAEIEGDLEAVDAEISGYVNGEIVISNKLLLRETARVIGKITTSILNVEDGAKMSGICEMKMEKSHHQTPKDYTKKVEDITDNSTKN
jgi:cytoskeletal protein CcmA (bactofilin family)